MAKTWSGSGNSCLIEKYYPEGLLCMNLPARCTKAATDLRLGRYMTATVASTNLADFVASIFGQLTAKKVATHIANVWPRVVAVVQTCSETVLARAEHVESTSRLAAVDADTVEPHLTQTVCVRVQRLGVATLA